ncbi:hypothetical protein [Caproicibacter sp. BJN0012]|uniref:hypothetical protein n=1 Tax=Caproicibacter sp. BJN0012 TaxID=3110227 RepID=UPI002E151304
MSSIRSITASNPVPIDLVNKIGIDGVNEILAVLWMGYEELRKDPSTVISVSTEEDDITQDWFVKIQRIWDARNRATCICLNQLVPHHQYADSTFKKAKGRKSPTIDFCFRDWDTANSYFGAECKNLYTLNLPKIKRYIETGICNFTSGRYGSQSSQASMIGYVLSGNIPDIVEQLKKELLKENPTTNITRTMSATEPQYRSIHMRKSDGVRITIHHLFFNFVV